MEARNRARLAEQRSRADSERLRQAEQERDRLRLQVEEYFVAMEEIRHRLAVQVDNRDDQSAVQ